MERMLQGELVRERTEEKEALRGAVREEEGGEENGSVSPGDGGARPEGISRDSFETCGVSASSGAEAGAVAAEPPKAGVGRAIILVLAGLAMVGPLAIDTYLPSLHVIGREFAVEQVLVQQTLSVYLFFFAFTMLFAGTLSDSFGRRPVILGSLVLYVAASFGAALSPLFGHLLFFRGLQGLAAAGGAVVGRAVVQDLASGAEAHRVMSYITMVFGLAPAIAPILGGWLHVLFGWRSVFLFLAAFALLMSVALFRLLPESLPRGMRHRFRPASILADYGKVVRNMRFLRLILSMGTFFIGFGLYIGSAASFVINILHQPETGFGWLFVPLVAGMVTGSATSARLTRRFSTGAIIRIGFGVMGAAALCNVAYTALFAPALPWAVLPLMLYAFGMNIAAPGITVTALALFPESRGLAASLQAFVQTLILAVVSGFLAPLLYDSAFKLACGVLAALLSSLALYLPEMRKVRA